MPRAVVVLPSTTYRAADFVRAAESLGIELVVASEQPPPFDMGDRYLQIDCSDPEAAAEAVARLGDSIPLDGVLAADDGGVVIAALAGSKLGLLSNHPDAAAATRDKARLRDLLRRAEVPQPRYAVVENDADVARQAGEVGFPLVVKPTTRSASQGVVRADDLTQLKAAVARVRRIVGRQETLLLEEYMPGHEVAVEGLAVDGELTVLAIFDKPDTSQGPAFPETIMVTPSRLSEETQDEIRRVASHSVRGSGLTHGPVHVELKVDAGQVRIIELAARSIGGLCSRSLSFGLMDTSLETLILRNAIGADKPGLRRERQANGVLMIPIPKSGVLNAVTGVDEVREIEGITGVDITIQAGTTVMAPPDGDRYLGFVFARTNTPEEAESVLRQAMSSIEVLVT
ncbi:MAG: ATP-grasp domain-containing protein [Actinomycetota bacterium]|nr:ATP-grasp domain-containing protein [Actinomycetota bacterium]